MGRSLIGSAAVLLITGGRLGGAFLAVLALFATTNLPARTDQHELQKEPVSN